MKTPFKLKSGNKTNFKEMGSSPLNERKDFLDMFLLEGSAEAKEDLAEADAIDEALERSEESRERVEESEGGENKKDKIARALLMSGGL